MTHTQRLPPPVSETWDWQRLGACRGMDVQSFFHPPGERGAAARERERNAKQICAGCQVRPECLQHALRIEEPYGTWGGVGERERWEIVRRKRREARLASGPASPPSSTHIVATPSGTAGPSGPEPATNTDRPPVRGELLH
ncbi:MULTISPECIES: WhiB family transcriptional regulator [unclassified Pseudonocardia]|uniref:WhiB family transcriptional regulator n=1 Tax=Pseudonocardia sp. P1 TaxID=761194 RepID=UPI0001FFDDA9